MVAVLSCALSARAQGGDKNLPEVKIEGERSEKVSGDEKITRFIPGQKVVHIDSIVLQQYKFQNMANLISQQTSAFVKSYGFNGLATLNFRGASAAQSQVLWNGIPLQNAALGISDLSTLPVAMIDRVNIVYGGSSALWGSGNVGGALLLENDLPVFDSIRRKEMALSLGAGSFHQYSGGARVAFHDRRWSISANGFVQSARNDFRYTRSGNEVPNDNARLYSLGFMMNGAYRIAEGNTLSISAWFQNFDREIPAALFEAYSVKDRVDQSKRVMLHWRKEHERSQVYLKTALIEDHLRFADEAIGLTTANRSYQSYTEWGMRRSFGKRHTVLLFVPVNYSWMKDAAGQQLRAGVSASYVLALLRDKIRISTQASQQVIDRETVFLPGINASYAVLNWLTFRVNVQKSYRAPTLNELYYSPGGNPSLAPERGWTQDAGYTLKAGIARGLQLYHDVSVFNRDIKDWIVWFGGAIWTPHNIAEVKSRGMETENKLTYRKGNTVIHLGLNTAYVLATTQRSYAPNDGSIGKQIPYAPRYNGQLNAGITYKSLYINYNHTYTGYRFYTTDESAWVEPYHTGNVQLSYLLRLGGQRSLLLSGQANNIFNQQYQVVAQRPMPGTNFLFGARFSLAD